MKPDPHPPPRRPIHAVKSRGGRRRLVTLAPEAYYLPSEVAGYLRVATRTLANWRWKGGGPDYVKCGTRLVRYRGRDVLEWERTRSRRTTSDPGSPLDRGPVQAALRVLRGESRRG